MNHIWACHFLIKGSLCTGHRCTLPSLLVHHLTRHELSAGKDGARPAYPTRVQFPWSSRVQTIGTRHHPHQTFSTILKMCHFCAGFTTFCWDLRYATLCILVDNGVRCIGLCHEIWLVIDRRMILYNVTILAQVYNLAILWSASHKRERVCCVRS